MMKVDESKYREICCKKSEIEIQERLLLGMDILKLKRMSY